MISLGCHPPEGVTPDLFYLSDKFSHNFFPFGCHPWRVLPGAVRPRPYSDATVFMCCRRQRTWHGRDLATSTCVELRHDVCVAHFKQSKTPIREKLEEVIYTWYTVLNRGEYSFLLRINTRNPYIPVSFLRHFGIRKTFHMITWLKFCPGTSRELCCRCPLIARSPSAISSKLL